MSAIVVSFAISILQFQSNGIAVDIGFLKNLGVFFIAAFFVLIFLLLISAAIGAMSNIVNGSAITAFIWMIIVFLCPEFLNIICSQQANLSLKSTHQIEGQKLDKLMEFENHAIKESRRYKTITEKNASDERMAEHYWKDIFDSVEDIDLQMIESIRVISEKFHFWSAFNPVTFFKSTNNELSGVGFNNFVRLYRANRKIKRGFLRYYIDKRYHENYEKVVPYLAKGKNIIPAMPSLPAYFGLGVLVNLFYILCLLFFCYYRFLRYIFPLPEKDAPNDTFSVNYESGKIICHDISCPQLRNQLINVFLGRAQGFSGQLELDGTSVVTSACKKLAYLPNPEKLPPTLRIRDLFSLTPGSVEMEQKFAGKRLGALNEIERSKIILSLAIGSQPKIFLLDDYIYGRWDPAEILEIIGDLKEEGVFVLDFLSSTGKPIYVDKYYITHLKKGCYVTKKLGSST